MLVGVVVGVVVRVAVKAGVDDAARSAVGVVAARVGFALVARVCVGAATVGVGGKFVSAHAEILAIALMAIRKKINRRMSFDSRKGISRRKYNTRRGRVKIRAALTGARFCATMPGKRGEMKDDGT